MRKSQQGDEAFVGLIADTMELPIITVADPEIGEEAPLVKRIPWLTLIAAIMGSFVLGLGVRMAINLPYIIDRVEEKKPASTEKAAVAPAVVAQGADIKHELGRTIEVPIFVEQVLPFIPQGNAHKYRVLGGYLLDAEGAPDRTLPMMAVFTRSSLEWGVKPKDLVLVEGIVVMAEKTERVAATRLTPEQEKDLAYIAQRINYWDRVTVLGAHARLHDIQ